MKGPNARSSVFGSKIISSCSCYLRIAVFLAAHMSLGIVFHSFGTHTLETLSPHVLTFVLGSENKFPLMNITCQYIIQAETMQLNAYKCIPAEFVKNINTYSVSDG